MLYQDNFYVLFQYHFLLKNFLFLKLRKNIIKEATLIKGSLFYRISIGDFYLYIFSFFLAIFGL
ncbi:TPA: hypothetical protein ACSCZS_000759, partial [Campylobacter jejuni]